MAIITMMATGVFAWPGSPKSNKVLVGSSGKINVNISLAVAVRSPKYSG